MSWPPDAAPEVVRKIFRRPDGVESKFITKKYAKNRIRPDKWHILDYT